MSWRGLLGVMICVGARWFSASERVGEGEGDFCCVGEETMAQLPRSFLCQEGFWVDGGLEVVRRDFWGRGVFVGFCEMILPEGRRRVPSILGRSRGWGDVVSSSEEEE